MIAPATPLADLTEKEWDRQLFGSTGLTALLGWKLRYHTLRSKGSVGGFPDRVIVRERVIFCELKTETGKPSDVQREWLDGLAQAGAECYLWRPSDLDEIARILGKRWEHVFDGEDVPVIGLTARDERWWTPRSLWIPGVGRADTTAEVAANE